MSSYGSSNEFGIAVEIERSYDRQREIIRLQLLGFGGDVLGIASAAAGGIQRKDFRPRGVDLEAALGLIGRLNG